MNDKQKIKAKIGKLKSEYNKESDFRTVRGDTAREVLDKLLSFIDSLPEEPASEGIEEELERFAYLLPHSAEGPWPKDIDCKSVEARTKYGVRHAWSYEQVMNIVRHFAEWGRNHFEDKSEMVSEDLEEEIKRYINEEVIVTNENVVISKHHEFHNFYVENLADIAHHFANWQKQQMMKDAVDAIVHKGLYSKYIKEQDSDALSKALEGYNPCDRVKIIIIREEGK